MPQSIYNQNSFVSGVLGEKLKGRTDIQQYFQGLQQADNVMLLPQGGFQVSSGSIYVDMLPEKSGGGTSQVRTFQFSVSSNRSYLLVFVDSQLLVYGYGQYLFKFTDVIPNSVSGLCFTDGEITSINSAQIDNVCIFTQPDRGFRRLVAPIDGVDDSDINNWSFDEPQLIAPQIDYNDTNSPTPVDNIQELSFANFAEGDLFKIMIDGIATSEIAYSAGGRSTSKNIVEILKEHPLMGDDGIHVMVKPNSANPTFTITLSGSSTGDYEEFTAWPTESKNTSAVITVNQTRVGVSRKEDAWSALRGYPRVITFFSGRMYLANIPQKKSSMFASRSSSYFNFELNKQLDDDAIFATIATDKINEITNIVSGRNLQIFTSGAELYVPTEIPTPSNFEIRVQTNHGSSFVNPIQIDGATVFLESKGKTLREFLFSYQEDSYLANSISFLAQHLIIDPVDMDAQKGTESDDANYVIICNKDGTLAILNTLRSQQISAFSRRTTQNGLFKAVSVVDDVVYVIVERVINGVTRRNVEYWNYETLLDSSVLREYESPATTISGLDHLEGEEVKVIADNSNLTPKTVVGGEVILERPATKVDIGLWKTPVVVPMPLVGDGGTGNNQMRVKKLKRVSVRLFETGAIKFDGVTIPAKKFGDSSHSPLNTAPLLFTGVVGDLESNEGWSREQAPIITQEEPARMTVLSISYEMESR